MLKGISLTHILIDYKDPQSLQVFYHKLTGLENVQSKTRKPFAFTFYYSKATLICRQILVSIDGFIQRAPFLRNRYIIEGRKPPYGHWVFISIR